MHPDTNEIIALPMRLSGFVWFNVPVLVGMSFIPNQTIALNMFFQWAN